MAREHFDVHIYPPFCLCLKWKTFTFCEKDFLLFVRLLVNFKLELNVLLDWIISEFLLCPKCVTKYMHPHIAGPLPQLLVFSPAQVASHRHKQASTLTQGQFKARKPNLTSLDSGTEERNLLRNHAENANFTQGDLKQNWTHNLVILRKSSLFLVFFLFMQQWLKLKKHQKVCQRTRK